MRNVLFVFLFFSAFQGMAQVSDSICIQERYIAIPNSEENSALFGMDSNAREENDLVHVIKSLVETNKLNIYKKKELPNGRIEYSYIDYEEDFEKAERDTTNKQNWRPYFSFIEPQSDIPLTDEYGEPLVRLNKEGWEEYVYPTPEVFKFLTKDVDEIRIMEYHLINKSENRDEFLPLELSFYFRPYNTGENYEVFWVDIQELFDVIENKENYPWYEILKNKEYQGFQFMQTPCDYYNGYYHERYLASYHPLVIHSNESCEFNMNRNSIYRDIHLVFKMKKNCEEMTINLPVNWENALFNATRLFDSTEHVLQFEHDGNGKNYSAKINVEDKGDYTVFFGLDCFRGNLKLSIE